MRIWKAAVIGLGAAAATLGAAAVIKKPKSIYQDRAEEQNPFEGKRVRFVHNDREPVNADGQCGHLEEVPPRQSNLHLCSFYERILKRPFDLVLSFFALIVLAPVFLIISIAIYLDDPGPILFTQKRLGKNKQFFSLHKFRTMKVSTPHDVPTHMLKDPESYITRVGKVLRKMSLDELPQIWDIFIGNMSIVGPRPGLWNQDVLAAERDLYGANDVMPGLTGWAQVNGRDELEIKDKAKLDGEYVRKLSLRMDVLCILMTIMNVLNHAGVMEGGTGAMAKHLEEMHSEKEI